MCECTVLCAKDAPFGFHQLYCHNFHILPNSLATTYNYRPTPANPIEKYPGSRVGTEFETERLHV